MISGLCCFIFSSWIVVIMSDPQYLLASWSCYYTELNINMTFFFAEIKKKFQSQYLVTLIVWTERGTVFFFISSLISVGGLGVMDIGDTSKRILV